MSWSIAKTCFDAIRAKQSAVAAGYDPMVVENQDVYEGLLLRVVDSSAAIIESSEHDKESSKSIKPKTRRQTPLVNAGYAARVLSISNAIRSFVAYHELVSSFRKEQKQQDISTAKHNIRIVFLGCGVDVIGLWSRSLLSDHIENLSMTIVEVDTPEVCSIKRKMLIHQDMVRNLVERECLRDNPTANKPVTLSYHTGTIVLPSSSSPSMEEDFDQSSCDYVLIPGDLNDTTTLEPILEPSLHIKGNNPETEYLPTLVVSELVLSYVPPSGTDRLLQWCSRKLCRTPDSAMVSLEPLGSPIPTATDPTISVEKGYQTGYNQKFEDKMEKGRSKTQEHPCFFHPIGSSPESIVDRWSKAGFCPKTSSCTNLGIVSTFAASKRKRTFVCPELFDEHAGWILHLRSYTLVCGLVDPVSDNCTLINNFSCCDPWLFRRMLCPWRRRSDLALVRSGLPLVQKESRIVYTEIDICDEDSVRGLFQSTYGKEYTEKYPAIRKLIKGVLNKDLRKTEEPTPAPGSTGSSDTHTERPAVFDSRSSTIGNFYRSSGGIFLVAVKYTDILRDNDAVSYRRRQVVGCAGIRSSEGKKNPNNDAMTSLEIFRLAVDVHHRGRGIGRGLLRALEGFVREKQQRRGTALRFIANTLTILEAAGRLYESCGYQLHEQTPLGHNQLVLSTYVKKNRNENE